jgi:hypothetical protein
VKTATITMFATVLVCSLTASRTPLHAQPVSTSPALPAGTNHAPSTGTNQPSPATTGHTPPASTDHPQPASNRAQPATTDRPSPASRNRTPAAGGNVSVQGDDKPWNRGVPLPTREAARLVFLEGNRLFNVPLFAPAAEQYLAALGTWKHPAFYYNLAFAQLNLGQDLEARDSLEQALKYGPEPLGTEEFQEAKKQLQDIERHLGRIRVSCPTDGAEVTLDGATLFTGPGSKEVWVKAQPHEVSAKKAEYVTQAKRVTISPDTKATIDLSLSKLVEDRPWAVWKPWAVVGTGIAIAATGGVFHALSARNFNAYDKAFLALPCADTGCMDSDISPKLGSQLDRARQEQRVAVGGYIVGGALVVTGAVLVYMNRPHLAEHGATGSSGKAVAMVPLISADTFGLLVMVSY